MDSSTHTGGNALVVHSAFYSFPLGDVITVTAGPLVDQDDVVGATASVYSDSFNLSESINIAPRFA